jgi:hypothetical protein
MAHETRAVCTTVTNWLVVTSDADDVRDAGAVRRPPIELGGAAALNGRCGGPGPC